MLVTEQDIDVNGVMDYRTVKILTRCDRHKSSRLACVSMSSCVPLGVGAIV